MNYLLGRAQVPLQARASNRMGRNKPSWATSTTIPAAEPPATVPALPKHLAYNACALKRANRAAGNVSHLQITS